MPDYTLTRLDLFPAGMVVGVYDTGERLKHSSAERPAVPNPSIGRADQGRSLRQGGARAPISPAVQTQEMGPTGLVFSGLTSGIVYAAYAQVAGAHRYLWFVPA
jgi:hypothetical protein